jgi:putative membrane protein insertion efficiency factor
MKGILQIISLPLIGMIRLYQWMISPWLGPKCRFVPSCSQYAIEAFRKYGLFKGGWMAIRRISRCHPWGGSGHDPLA